MMFSPNETGYKRLFIGVFFYIGRMLKPLGINANSWMRFCVHRLSFLLSSRVLFYVVAGISDDTAGVRSRRDSAPSLDLGVDRTFDIFSIQSRRARHLSLVHTEDHARKYY